MFLLLLIILIILYFTLVYSTLLSYPSISLLTNQDQCSSVEFISTLLSLLLIIIIISPTLIILLDHDLIIVPTFIIYSLGLQWAWQFNIIFTLVDIGYKSYNDHYVVTTNQWVIDRSLLNFNSRYSSIFKKSIYFSDISLKLDRSMYLPFYLFEMNSYILFPMYSFIKLFVYSFDVIHTLGFYSMGIKTDAIPGKINSITTVRLLTKGEYRGKCFELCGQGHLSMSLLSLSI